MAYIAYILPCIHGVLNPATLLICVVVFLFTYTIISKLHSRLPPGPVGLPVVGSLFMLITSAVYKEHPHDLITRLAKRYGKVFCVSFGGGSRLVFLNDFSSVAEAYNNPNISDRPPGGAVKAITGGSGLLNVSGEAWKHQRRFSLSVFRSFGVGRRSFEVQITTEALFLSDEFASLQGKLFDPKHHLMNAFSNVICSVIFGRHFNYDDKEFRRLLAILDERMQLIGSGGLVTFVPILRKMFFRANQKTYIIVKEMVDYFKTIVDGHKSCFEASGECNDLIDLYLKEIKKLPEATEPSTFINESHLIAMIDSLFLAGTETSSNTLGWSFLYMAAYPDVQVRIQDEIQSTCGDRLPSYSDQQNMPYTQAVILELQRLHTVTPLGVPHYAGAAATIQGYNIPKGTFVITNQWGILHDPDVWPEPDVFKPERFLDADGEIIIPKEWIPFSIGRRSCLGERLAKMEIFIFLTHLLKRFSFKKPDTCSKMCFEGRSGATLSPLPFKIAAIPRILNK